MYLLVSLDSSTAFDLQILLSAVNGLRFNLVLYSPPSCMHFIQKTWLRKG